MHPLNPRPDSRSHSTAFFAEYSVGRNELVALLLVPAYTANRICYESGWLLQKFGSVQCRIGLCGQNVNFVCGLVDKSLDVQINAIRIKFVKYKHKYRNQHAVVHKLYTWSLEETWFKVSGDEVGLFCCPLQNVNFRGTAGTHCLGEFQYLNHGFRVGLGI